MARITRAESEARPAGRLRIRILLAAGEPFGPGKAELLEAIRDSGSIAAAGEIEALAAEATAERLDWLRRQLAPG